MHFYPVILSFDFTLANLLLLSLATWRIAHAFLYEIGPYDILVKIRGLFGVSDDNFTHEHFWTTCFLCTSFWVAILCLFLPIIILWPFALSAGAILIERINDRGDSES